MKKAKKYYYVVHFIGFNTCEVTLDLEGIRKGMYDSEDGNVDPRLHDGYWYGPALLRI